jgi:hypothetical protein
MADDAAGDANGGALLSDPVDVIIDKLLRYAHFLCYFHMRAVVVIKIDFLEVFTICIPLLLRVLYVRALLRCR